MVLIALLLATHSFGWPLHGTPMIERPFTPPTTAYGAGHRGVDLRAAAGDRVLAVGQGQVTYVGVLAGRGVVTVTHAGGLRTTYEPVLPSVRLGVTVGRGAVLGRVATGHGSCRRPTCLHWGLLRGSTYLDPFSLLDRRPVVLLPLAPAPAPLAPPRAPPPTIRRTTTAAAATGALLTGGVLLGRGRASRRARTVQDGA
jgi:murein DD-endopeptidase MepM/ murein hydrolase activator NlpD